MSDCMGGVKLQVQRVESPQAAELFITAPARPEAFQAIATLLREQRAALWMERIFAPAECVDTLKSTRAHAYGDLVDGVEPCWLVSPGNGLGGIQVHALQASARPEAVTIGQRPVGRILALGNCRWVAGSGLGNPSLPKSASQAGAAFGQARGLLARAGADFRCVARTWFFLDDILSWYGPFNQIRNALFQEQGLIGDLRCDDYLPASTGIGVSPASGDVAMDLIAAVGPDCRIIAHQAAGRQRSAYEYGSAFSRASEMASPAGRMLFVSGTAAIDASGASCYPGDARGQIRMTLDNVLAVLAGVGYGPRDVVQAIAYCVTPEVAAEFQAGWAAETGWPWVTVLGDICRQNLLFEVEVTACRAEPA